ncbi:hypothetical protein ACHAXN_004225 [Cyclotella atomus]
MRKLERKRERQRDRIATIVADLAATSTVIRNADAEHVDVLETKSQKVFQNANGTLSSTGNEARLKYNLREPAGKADMVPDLATNSLLSTAKCADANYATLFTKDKVRVFDLELTKINIKGEAAVMTGWRCPKTKLWRIQSKEATDIIMSRRSEHPDEFVNNVYELPNLEQVVAWYHAAAGYPTKTTWIKAIEAGSYATRPLLTVKAVKKHYPETKETPKGHMKRVKSGVRSTKEQVQEHPEVEAALSNLADLQRKHRDAYVQIKESGEMIYSDQTGRFPVTSSGGHKYIMVLVEIDSNFISMEPMKSRKTSELIRSYNNIMLRLKTKGIQPKKQMLDNEAPRAYLDTIEEQGLERELVPPHNHRRNVAERAIQTARGIL